MIVLRVTPVKGPSFDHDVDSGPVVVGRSSQCEVQITDRSMSRRHARIFRHGDDWFVEDLGSRNGTALNGTTLGGREMLKDGDVVAVGASTITVMNLDGETAPPPADPFGGQTMFRPAAELLESSSEYAAISAEDRDALRQSLERLRLLNEVHQALSRSVTLDELLVLILERAFDHLQPEEGAVFLRTEDGEYQRAASRTLGGAKGGLYSRHLVEEVAEKGLAALVLDTQLDSRFKEAASLMSAGFRSLVAAPLLDPEGSLGMIVLGSRINVRQFREEDMELLTSLASVAAMRIRNVRLAEEAAERRRLEKEVKLARAIQIALLPSRLPSLDNYSLHAGNLPSQGVSGDFYKVLRRDEERELVLLVADVSGKGIGASLLTGALEALSAAPIDGGAPPDEVCRQVSRLLFERTPPEKFATAFLVVLKLEDGTLTYANAGHNPGLVVRRDGTPEWLEATGLPVGVLPAVDYTASTVGLEPGDTLVLYTDGITEAMSPAEEEYGPERLLEVCKRHRSDDLEALAEAIENDLESFADGVPFADDRTLVLLRRLAPGPGAGGQ